VKNKKPILTFLFIFVMGSTTIGFAQDEKLQTIQKKIEGISRKLMQLKQEKKTLLNEIYRIELSYEKDIVEINKIDFKLKETNLKIQKKEDEKKALEILIEDSKNNIKEIIRILYKLGRDTNIKLFFQVDSVDQLFNNYRLFVSLVNYKSGEINKIKESIALLNTVKGQLQEEYTKLEGFKDSKRQRVRSMQGLRRVKLNYIKGINSDKKKYLQLRNELQYEASRINQVISGKRVRSSLKVLNLNKIKGRLEWPLRGKVVSTFGKKRSDRFDTYIINNGIEIAPTGSDKVKAVYPGDVVFADYFKGKGNLIIIQHSRDLYTLYGHCDKMFKKRGDNIKKGEIIAIAGDTGSTFKKSLYFEIRRDLKPQDPLSWLRKK
jgi:septal ring factor EnvC (AmiA/AmiB activator)